MSILKEDPFLFLKQIETGNFFDSSEDELDMDQMRRPSSSRKSERSKSVSEVLDILHDTSHAHQSIHHSDQILIQDLECLQNDREAYKMAWLSQRQLARTCMDLNIINQSPGWAQTQIAETIAVCKLNHQGGSVPLPDSDIIVHVPQGNIAIGEFQDFDQIQADNEPERVSYIVKKLKEDCHKDRSTRKFLYELIVVSIG